MKVIHLMNSLKPSGMERMFVSAAPYFQQCGLETVIVGQGNDHPFRYELERCGYKIVTVPGLKTHTGARAFSRLLKTEQPDVLHIHSEGTYGLATLVAKLTDPKLSIVRTIHNVFRPKGKGKIKRRVESLIADRMIAEFISVSADVQDNERKFGRNSTLIYNWVEDRFFQLKGTRQSTKAQAKRSIAIVGNSSPIKNHETALVALRDLPLDLYFHGDERDANPTETRILNALEREGRLLHRGTGDPAASLVAADAYAMPSKHEGMGIALAEALVVGTPAVITDAPGLTWAAGLPGVTVLQDDVNEWRKHFQTIVSANTPKTTVGDLPIDLSARRGAADYIAVYYRLSSRAA